MDMRPDRIVTLLPSATEIVCELGLQDRLVGVSHECDYPAGIEKLPHVTRSAIDHHAPGGEIDAAVRSHLATGNALYSLDKALLTKLAPDLIITQALCEVCAVPETDVLAVIRKLPGEPALVNLEPMTLTEVFDTITLVGRFAGCAGVAERYRRSLEHRVERVQQRANSLRDHERPTVGFLEWVDPPFNAGHWTPEIIEYAGGIDSFGNKHRPSQTISHETLIAADPDVLIIALCGFDAARARRELETSALDLASLTAWKKNRVYVLDGNACFSRPGPRLVDSLEILFRLLHPAPGAGPA